MGEVYQIKVTLLGAKPPIWRRLIVPSDLTLAQLHKVLQIAMGWHDAHIHEFRAGKRRFGTPEPASPFAGTPSIESERKTVLSAVLDGVDAKLRYIYDFGDNWEHGIVLAKQFTASSETTCPACIDGQRACPPEDCGGIPGYCDLLDALSDPGHEQHEELRDWIGDNFAPDTFSPEEVRLRLRRRLGRSPISRGFPV